MLKSKIAILFICTGKYDKFWHDFYRSCEEYFCVENEKHYFVFTDSKVISSQPDITKVYQDSLGWSFNTLYRYRMFRRIAAELKNYDYCVYFNANCLFLQPITIDEFFGSDNKELVACKHPGFFDKKTRHFTYEERRASNAYVYTPHYYFAGGINGGKSIAFLQLIDRLANGIELDLDKGIMAVWHDESHWNAYLNNNFIQIAEKLHILSSAYLYPEDWEANFIVKIVIKDKRKVLDIVSIKSVFMSDNAVDEGVFSQQILKIVSDNVKLVKLYRKIFILRSNANLLANIYYKLRKTILLPYFNFLILKENKINRCLDEDALKKLLKLYSFENRLKRLLRKLVNL